MTPSRPHLSRHALLAAPASLLLAASAAQANLRLVFETDPLGNPTTGSYVGGGMVDPNIVSGTGGHFIAGVGTGDVIGVDIIDNSTVHNFSPSIINMDTTFNFGAGTADIEFANTPSGGPSHFKGWNITNLQGASKLGFTSVFSDPIHARSDNRNNRNGFPWGFSTGLLSAGTGFTPQDFDVMYTIGGLQYSPTPGVASSFPTNPIPNYTPFASTGWDNGTTPNSVVFNSADGFNGLNTNPTTGPSANNLLVRGFDDDGGSLSSADARQFYAHSFNVMITPLDSSGNPTTFASDARFVFSYDGDRRLELEPIPEPSRAFLLGVASVALLVRRRR